MAITIWSLLHAGVRIPPEDEDVAKARAVYGDLLGLEFDEERGHIADIPGFWVNIKPGERGQQIHVFGADGIRGRRAHRHASSYQGDGGE